MRIKHSLTYGTQTEQLVLAMFYKYDLFRWTPEEPQQHSEVQGVSGCSPKGVGFQFVHVAKVLGMSVSATSFELTVITQEVLRHFYSCQARDPVEGNGEVLL